MSNKIFLFVFTIVLMSCKNDTPKNYATISGKITNHFGNNGSVSGENYKKEITISKDGTFSDTLHVKTEGQLITFSDGNEFTSMYIKNGDNLQVTLDTKEFDETIKYSGKGEANNNYLARKSLLFETLFTATLFELEEKELKEKIKEITSKFENLLEESKGLDAHLIKLEKEEFANTEKQILEQYNQMKQRKNQFADFIGKPSPDFVNYENYNGGTTSLKDLRGKYVYIDIWATWCGPCKKEIPFLQTLEKQYHEKNIAFVSISVDSGRGYKGNSKELSKEGWRKMIKEKEMGGIQLFADKDFKSDFVTAYKIKGIPRFILIDPSGNIVDANASRPSSPKTAQLFDKLLN